MVTDPGAVRDLVDSLAEGLAQHVGDVRRLVPGAEVVVQLDEPSLPAVLQGGLPTVSGFGKLSAVEAVVVEAALTRVVDRLRAADVATVVAHCCAPDVPLGLLRAAGVDAVALDTVPARPAGLGVGRGGGRGGHPAVGRAGTDLRRRCPRRPSWSTGCTGRGATSAWAPTCSPTSS